MEKNIAHPTAHADGTPEHHTNGLTQWGKNYTLLSVTMLKSLKLSGVGPAESMEAELAPRLNVFTGDNGLGKSFLLDVIWWCYTGIWPHDLNSSILSGRKAMPQDTADNAEIVLVHDDNETDERNCYIFNFLTQEWERKYEALHGGGGYPHAISYLRHGGW